MAIVQEAYASIFEIENANIMQHEFLNSENLDHIHQMVDMELDRELREVHPRGIWLVV